MKSFFEEVFGNSFGWLFDFPFTEKETNDEDMHSYFHSISEKYKDGKRVSHVEKEVKDGKVLKDIKEEPKLQLVSDNKNVSTSVNVMDELNALRKEHEQLKECYDELRQKYSNLNEVYTNTCNRLKDVCNALETKKCNNEGKE